MGAGMKVFFLIIAICISSSMFAVDRNLVIIVDNVHHENVKSQDVTMTHQCLTALQQQASMVLMSTGLWKNIVDRKKRFEKGLHNAQSPESLLYNLYQTTHHELALARYNLTTINQKLSKNWFEKEYPDLSRLSLEDFNQLRFDFACYIFKFDFDSWNVYTASEGMLLWIPVQTLYPIDKAYKIFHESDMMKIFDKKSNVVGSLQKLLHAQQDRFVVYLTGHGHPQSTEQKAHIAGLLQEDFRDLLDYFHASMHLKLLVYSSCYGGGVHCVQPYQDIRLHYPVIVTAVTDAPIFGFGLYEGVKLPPYDTHFMLDRGDVDKKQGLLPYALQNYAAFFKRAWKGQFDLQLVQLISKFFSCDFFVCHVQKIENFPLIRKAGSAIFVPIKDQLMIRLVQQATGYASLTLNKPLLMYTKKIKKIKMEKLVPIVSMLPGLQSHMIDQLIAPNFRLSDIIVKSFVSLEDMQAYKNYLIPEVSCINDLVDDTQVSTIKNLLIVGQDNVRPKFMDKKTQVLIYFQSCDQHYCASVSDQKIVNVIKFNQDQIAVMQEIIQFVRLMVDFDTKNLPENLLTFDAYQQNAALHDQIVQACIKNKVCKKR